jgi:hypothetical protein
VVSTGRKTWLITRAMLARAAPQRPAPAAADVQVPVMVEAIRYLVEHAVEPTALPAAAAPDSFYERTVWVIELCERLRERERLGAARG